jgi:osmoprotectant transport system permease protein
VSYLFAHPREVAFLLAQHVELTAAALCIAFAIGLPLGVLAARNRRASAPLLGILGAIYTLPSLALFALLIPLLGLGFLTALVALVAYAQVILVRNVAAGLRGVPEALRDAARGLGMTPWQSFWRVELPQALPVIVGGVRIATVSLVAIANLAAWIDAGGLGVLLFAGLSNDDTGKIVAGSLASGALAIGADAALRALERRLGRAAG